MESVLKAKTLSQQACSSVSIRTNRSWKTKKAMEQTGETRQGTGPDRLKEVPQPTKLPLLFILMKLWSAPESNLEISSGLSHNNGRILTSMDVPLKFTSL